MTETPCTAVWTPETDTREGVIAGNFWLLTPERPGCGANGLRLPPADRYATADGINPVRLLTVAAQRIHERRTA